MLFQKYEDFYVTYLNKDYKWKKWKKYSELNDYELKNANNRQVLKTEVVVDVETKDENIMRYIIAKLDFFGYGYSVWDTGGKGYHIHLFFDELDKFDADVVPYIKKYILLRTFGNLSCIDLQKTFNKVLIALEYSRHRKTGKPKILIFDKEGINKLDSSCYELAKELKSSDKKDDLIKKYVKDYKHHIEFVNFLKEVSL